MTKRLFVYGTLAPGRPNDHVLEPIDGTWKKATVRGNLRAEGWGADIGYPGIVLDEEGEEIEGHLFISENLPNHWDAIDEFEGEGYERVATQATLEDESSVDAYIYVLQTEE